MRRGPQKPRVIAFDPSLTAFGYVVMEGSVVIQKGCIKTTPANKKLRIRKGDDRMHRINEIAKQLLPIIQNNNVVYIVSELPHGSQSAVAAIALGLVNGMVGGISAALGIPVEWFSEADAKLEMLGKRSSTKQEMIDACVEEYGADWVTGTKYKDEAVADSLAIYAVAVSESPVISYLM